MGYYNLENWKPQEATQKILNRAMEHINSVSYGVSARWVFYRLLQDGLYEEKKDYDNLLGITGRARRAYWEEWNPLTLVDETREIITSATDGEPPIEVTDELIERVTAESQEELESLKCQVNDFTCSFYHAIDPWYLQEYFVVIAFEARAMSGQFQQYTKGLTLVPCGGQPSIPHRYNTAKYIKEMASKYDLPAVLLYFGDCDDAGKDIYNSFMEDLYDWCDGIEVVYCGLTKKQIQEFSTEGNPVPENPGEPGKYQWEALTDEQAHQIISTAIIPYYDESKIHEAKEKSREIEREVEKRVNENLDL